MTSTPPAVGSGYRPLVTVTRRRRGQGTGHGKDAGRECPTPSRDECATGQNCRDIEDTGRTGERGPADDRSSRRAADDVGGPPHHRVDQPARSAVAIGQQILQMEHGMVYRDKPTRREQRPPPS